MCALCRGGTGGWFVAALGRVCQGNAKDYQGRHLQRHRRASDRPLASCLCPILNRP
jgi:hypothetical protein